MSGETKRLTASERNALLRLNVAAEILIKDIHELDRRARLVPYARRDLAMLSAVADRLLKDFARTIPPEQQRSYMNELNMACYSVGVKPPGKLGDDLKNFDTVLSYEVLNTLLAGCHDHCLMCPADKGQRRVCKLRKALETIPNDSNDREDGDCPFYTLI